MKTFFFSFSSWLKEKACTNLYQEDDEEVEIGNSSKLFKQVLW